MLDNKTTVAIFREAHRLGVKVNVIEDYANVGYDPTNAIINTTFSTKTKKEVDMFGFLHEIGHHVICKELGKLYGNEQVHFRFLFSVGVIYRKQREAVLVDERLAWEIAFDLARKYGLSLPEFKSYKRYCLRSYKKALRKCV